MSKWTIILGTAIAAGAALVLYQSSKTEAAAEPPLPPPLEPPLPPPLEPPLPPPLELEPIQWSINQWLRGSPQQGLLVPVLNMTLYNPNNVPAIGHYRIKSRYFSPLMIYPATSINEPFTVDLSPGQTFTINYTAKSILTMGATNWVWVEDDDTGKKSQEHTFYL